MVIRHGIPTRNAQYTKEKTTREREQFENNMISVLVEIIWRSNV